MGKVLKANLVDEAARSTFDGEITGARRKQRYILLFGISALLMLALGLSALVNDDRGTIQVICNIPEARVILDTVGTDYYTDSIIPGIPPGRHLVTLEKTGYKIEGDAIQEITVKSRDTIVLSFYLVPISEESARSDKRIVVDAPVRKR